MNYFATNQVILLMVTQLRYDSFLPGTTILEKGKKAGSVYFIKTNAVVVVPIETTEKKKNNPWAGKGTMIGKS